MYKLLLRDIFFYQKACYYCYSHYLTISFHFFWFTPLFRFSLTKSVTCVRLLVGEAQCFFTHMFAKKLFKTINDKQITVFITTKRRPNFSINNYSFNLFCSLKAKSILEVSKICKGSLLFDFECGHD